VSIIEGTGMSRHISVTTILLAALIVLVSRTDAQWSQAKITSRQLAPPWLSTITATASYDNRHIAIDKKGNHWIYLIGDQTWYWRQSDFPSDIIDAEWPSANIVVILRSNGTLRAYRWPERTIQWEVDVQGTNRLTYNLGRYVCYSSEQVKVVHPTTLAVETTSWNKTVVAASYGPKGTTVLLEDGSLNVVQGESMTTTYISTKAPVQCGGMRGNLVAFASNREMGTIRMVNDEIDTIQIHNLPDGIVVERDEFLVTDSGTVIGTLMYDNTKFPLIIDAERHQRQNTWTRGDLRIPRAVSPRYVMLSWGYIFIIGNDASIRRLGYNTIDKSWVLNYQSVPSSGATVLDRIEREDGKLVSLLRCAPPYQPWEVQSTSAILRHSTSDTLESWATVPNQFSSGGRIVAVTDEQVILTSPAQTLAVDLTGVVTELFTDDPRCDHFRALNNKLYSLYAPAIISTNYGERWDSIELSKEKTIGGFLLTDSIWAVKTLVDDKPGTSAWFINRPNGEYVPVYRPMSPLHFYPDVRGGERCIVIDWSVSTGVTHGFYEYIDTDSTGKPVHQYEAVRIVSDPLFKVHIDVQRRRDTAIFFDVDRAISPTRMRLATYSADGSSSFDVIGLPVMERARVAHAYRPHPLVVVVTYDEGTEFTYDLRATSSLIESEAAAQDITIRLADDAHSIEVDAVVVDAYVTDYTGQHIPHRVERFGADTRVVFSSSLRRGVYAIRVVLENGSTYSALLMQP